MDWSYVAGFFDGEGHVGLHPAKHGGKQILLTMSNTHAATVAALHVFLIKQGLNASVSTPAKRLNRWKRC